MLKNKSSFVADRVKAVPASGIRKFFDLVLSSKDVVSLGVGEPDFVTPWHVCEAAIYSIEKGYTMYTSNFGILELREAISRYLKKDYGVNYNPKTEIIVTVGSSEALDLALRAVVNPGDEVLVPEPCFVSYKPCAIFAGGVPVPVKTCEEENYELNVKELQKKVTPKTKVLLMGYPSNPTGAIMPENKLREVAAFVKKNNLFVISDELYHKLTYDGKHACFTSLPGMKERTIFINGFSKTHAMTGWRVGFACAEPDILEAMMKIHQYTMMCASIMGQKAALEALKNGDSHVEDMRQKYDERRRFLIQGLASIGMPCFEPKGAFYAFPNIKKSGMSSEEFANKLFKEEKVVVVPGSAFGECGEGFIRLSYASSIRNLEKAVERMARFVKKYG